MLNCWRLFAKKEHAPQKKKKPVLLFLPFDLSWWATMLSINSDKPVFYAFLKGNGNQSLDVSCLVVFSTKPFKCKWQIGALFSKVICNIQASFSFFFHLLGGATLLLDVMATETLTLLFFCVFNHIFYQFLRVQHSCSSTQSWGSVFG